MDKAKGYKAFYDNMTNNYGQHFEEGKIYTLPETIPLIPGPTEKGFHYTPYLEDTLRYVDGRKSPIQIAKVSSLGERVGFNDEYSGYYDIQNTRVLQIDHIMTRDEIMDTMMKKSDDAMKRFIIGYALTEEEVDQILSKYYAYIDVIKHLLYYQYQDKLAFQRNQGIEEVNYQLQKTRRQKGREK